MKRYTAAQARQQFAELLDVAEQGRPVVIERRGVQFVVEARPRGRRRPASRKSVIAAVDPAVAAGEWTWELRRKGLRFQRRPRRR